MSTRGAYGFIKNKEIKASYNHFDSYLEGLGVNMVDFIRTTNKEELNKIFDKIILVEQTDKPNKKQNKEITQFLIDYGLENEHDINHFGSGDRDWYYILSNCQGHPEFFKYGLRYMTNDKDFLDDHLFCEYAYLIDLDNDKFIIKSDDREVRYDLDNIPENWIEATYPKLENSCKNKYMKIMFDRSEEEQKEILKELGIDLYVESSFDKYNYYTIENNYKDVLNNINEIELEDILDKYLNKDKDLEVA